MDPLSQAIGMWQLEAAVAVAACLLFYAIHSLRKVWISGEGVSHIFILGAGLAIVTVLFLYLRNEIHWFGNRYALYFVLLYAWCALGMIFVSYRQTSGFKLTIALLLQAGVVYGLYRIV